MAALEDSTGVDRTTFIKKKRSAYNLSINSCALPLCHVCLRNTRKTGNNETPKSMATFLKKRRLTLLGLQPRVG